MGSAALAEEARKLELTKATLNEQLNGANDLLSQRTKEHRALEIALHEAQLDAQKKQGEWGAQSEATERQHRAALDSLRAEGCDALAEAGRAHENALTVLRAQHTEVLADLERQRGEVELALA